MNRVTLTRAANRDLNHLHDYIADISAMRAARMVRRIMAKLDRLANNPFLGHDCSRHAPNLRFSPVKPYVIYFLPTSTGIEVVRILHGAQDADAELAGL